MTLDQIKAAPAGSLPAPAYTNAAAASAIARMRRETDSPLWRVVATYDATGKPFGFDLPQHDAAAMRRDLTFNPGYSDVELFRVR